MNDFENISDLFSERVKIEPKAIAVYIDKKAITYEELDFFIWKVGTFLYKNGIKPGSVVTLTFRDEFTLLVTMLAVARIGATVFILPLHTPSLLSIKMLRKVKSEIQLTDISDIHETTLPVLLVDLKALIKDKTPINFNSRSISPSDFWIIVSGSGSTGESKMIPITHKQQISRLNLKGDWFSVSTKDCFASLMHLNHYTTIARYLATFYFGGSVLIFDRSIKTIDLFKNTKITLWLATVFHIRQMMTTLPLNSKNIMPSLKGLLITGSSVPSDLRQQIRDRICSELFVLYGINECSIVSAAEPPAVYQVPGTVGFPLNKVDVEIFGENEKILPHGEIGQIGIKTPGMIYGYLNDEEATQKAFKNGWFYPGDLGKFTEDGQLIHLGRADHMMIMNGINIYPAEIEQIITSHPEVEDAAAMPIKSSIHQDIPVCAVVLSLNSKLTEKALLEYTYQRLGARGPKRVIVLDVIPRNEQGKLIRQELTDAINLELSTSGRSNVAPKKNTIRKYTQTILPFTIQMKRDLPKNLEHIDEWLTSVLGIDIEPLPYSICSADAKTQNHTLAFVWRILLLSRTLLQSIRVPLFDPGEIRNINESDSKYYGITVGMVQIDHIPQNVYIKSLHTASNIILNFMKKPITAENRKILFEALKKEFITPLSRLSGSGKSTMPILREAHKRNIPFKHLKNGVYQLGWGSRSRRMNRSSTERDSLIGGMMSHSKMVTAALVRDAGLPSPVHNMVRSKEEALSVVKDLGWPIVVKPADSDRGEGVTVDVTDDTTLIEAFSFAKDASKAKQIIIEQQVDGICCRVFIAGQKMLYAVMRLPKSVKGNGKNSVQELIDEANRVETEMPPWKKTELFPLDEMATKAMGAAGFKLDSIPEPDQLVPLKRIESTQWGGVDEDVTDTIHPNNIDLALRAAKLFGLHVTGIDIITPDITVPWYENGAIVNEVNFSPLFGGGEISRRAIPHFLDDFIEGDGRIPITIIKGSTEAMERALAMQKEQVGKGIQCFVSSHQKSIDWMDDAVHFTSNSLQDRCRALLMDSRVEALILVVRTEKY